MANIKSAKLRIKKTRVKTSQNTYWKNKVKNTIKAFELNKKEETLKDLFSTIDKASSKKIIHKNKARRLKSRFSKMV